jgi:ABC-type multidrug transport system fused ATPase/permease subunit
VGVLTTIFAEDIQSLNGLTTETISAFTEAILGTVISCIICFRFDWRLALVATAISPFLIFGGYFSSKLQFGFDSSEDAHYASNALLGDIIMNHKTVISFGEKNVNYLI